MNAPQLTRYEVARRLADEFALPWGRDAAAREITKLLPLQRADEEAALRVVEGRVRGASAFVLCMLLGAGASLAFSDHVLAAMVLAAAAAVQLRRAKDVHRARIMRLSFLGSGNERSLGEQRERFQAELLPVLLYTHPDLFAGEGEVPKDLPEASLATPEQA